MKRYWFGPTLAILFVLASAAVAFAGAYGTPFRTSITVQNIGSSTANMEFQFFRSGSPTPVIVTRQLAAGASSSISIGSLQGVPSGSARIVSDQPLVATAVQVAQPGPSLVKNRPLYNAVGYGGSEVYIASVLKNKYDTNTILSIQNLDTDPVVVTLNIYNADIPLSPPLVATTAPIDVGAAAYYDFGASSLITATVFNGSAVLTAVKSGTSDPGTIAASVHELQIAGFGALAYEGVSTPSTNVYMATALCNAFGGNTTYYAVQNTNLLNSTNVTVLYSDGINTFTEVRVLQPGVKESFSACTAAGMPAGFSGAAQITSSNTNVIAIGKVAGGCLQTGFIGEPAGASHVYLPYIRYSGDSEYNAGQYQRAFVAIQNIGATAVNGVVVEYRDKDGDLVGSHALPTIAAKAKVNTNAVLATPAPGVDPIKLLYFGNPPATNGGFGGGAIVNGPVGAQLIALVRISSRDGACDVAEDYSGATVGSGTIYLPQIDS